MALKAPFPYFGGKADAAAAVWAALGRPVNYIEPFAGSAAVLLNRPDQPRVETVNDVDGLLINVWRSLAFSPDATAAHADWPVSEADLTARHLWLVRKRAPLTDKLLADPEWHDPQAAGWWIWGSCLWIGSGWCSGKGPWTEENGVIVKANGREGSVNRKIPHINTDGKGVHKPSITRQMPHLGNDGQGIHKPSMRSTESIGVSRQIPHLGNDGKGVHKPGVAKIGALGDESHDDDEGRLGGHLRGWFQLLQARLRNVRFCCGDWARVVTPSVTYKHLVITNFSGSRQEPFCGVFLDPPYDNEEDVYVSAKEGIAAEVLAWCLENGEHPKMRIVLAGYEGQGNEVLEEKGWTVQPWYKGGFLRGGYANQSGKSQQHRERLWLSPACVRTRRVEQLSLL